MPLTAAEAEHDDPAVREVVDQLSETGILLQTAEGDRWVSAAATPHRQVDIRAVGAAYAIVMTSDSGRDIALGKSEGIRALKECHPGAIYLHHGGSYQVDKLDMAKPRDSCAAHRSALFHTGEEREGD